MVMNSMLAGSPPGKRHASGPVVTPIYRPRPARRPICGNTLKLMIPSRRSDAAMAELTALGMVTTHEMRADVPEIGNPQGKSADWTPSAQQTNPQRLSVRRHDKTPARGVVSAQDKVQPTRKRALEVHLHTSPQPRRRGR